MKKKYRRAVCFTLISIICLIFSPILLMGGMGIIAGWVCEKLLTPIVGCCVAEGYSGYQTYEQALSDGIKDALQLLDNENK